MRDLTLTVRRAFSSAAVVLLTAAPFGLASAQTEAPPEAPPAATDLPAGAELFDKCVEAMGGEEAFKSIKSSRVVGVAELAGMGNMTLELMTGEGDKFYAKQSLEGMGEFISGSDGKVVWGTDPMTGGLRIMTGPEAEQSKGMAAITLAVPQFKKEAASFETLEKTDFRGASCYKVKTIDKEGEEATVYFDAATGFLAGVEETQENPMMGPVLVVMNFLDYKEVEPITTYSRIMVDQGGMEVELKFTEIEFNKVDPAKFELPAEVKELVAAQESEETPETPAESDEDDDDDGGEDDGDDDGDGDGGR